MIIVKPVVKTVSNNIVRLSCKFVKDEVEEILWFETSVENEHDLSLDNCDSFFVILFLLAIHSGLDIKLETPVSRRLLYGIENYLMDTLLIMNPQYKRIKIEANINDSSYPRANGVATAMSLGIDSFYTLAKNSNGIYPITHLTLFNAGAFGQNGGEKTRELFFFMIEQVKCASKNMQLPLVWVDTNLNEVLNLSFVKSHTFRNLSCALLFQNLFGTYFYSSGHYVKDLQIDGSDTANYDLINALSLTSNNLVFQIYGIMATRVEKTKELTKFPPTKNYLNVCLVTTDYKDVKVENSSFQNCSKCYKCVRTMITLDVIGKLWEYEDIFDLKLFQKNKSKYLADIIYHYLRSKNVFSVEILKEIKTRKYKITCNVYYHLILRIFKTFLKIIKPNLFSHITSYRKFRVNITPK